MMENNTCFLNTILLFTLSTLLIKHGRTSSTEGERGRGREKTPQSNLSPAPSVSTYQRKWCQSVSKLPSVSPGTLQTQETSGADKHNDHNTWVCWIRSLSSAQQSEERREGRERRQRTGERGETGCHFSLGFFFFFSTSFWTSSDNKRKSWNGISLLFFFFFLPSGLLFSLLSSGRLAQLLIYFFLWSLKKPVSIMRHRSPQWAHGRSLFIVRSHLKKLWINGPELKITMLCQHFLNTL